MSSCCWLLFILTDILDSRISCQDCHLQLTWGEVPDTPYQFLLAVVNYDAYLFQQNIPDILHYSVREL